MKKIWLYITGAVAVLLGSIAAWLAVAGISGRGQDHDHTDATKNAHKANAAAAKDRANEALAEIAAVPNARDRANAYREFIRKAIARARQSGNHGKPPDS